LRPRVEDGGIAQFVLTFAGWPSGAGTDSARSIVMQILNSPTASPFTVPPPGRRTASEPQTALGKRLRELRLAIVASGVKLLNWNELEREIAERRGEIGPET